MLCSTLFWQLLQQHWCQAVLDSTFPLDNISGMERVTCCMGNCQFLKTLERTLHSHLTAMTKHGKLVEGFQKVLLYGELAITHEGDLIFAKVDMDIERWEKRCQQLLMLEMWFTHSAWVRREEMKTCCQGETCSKERKQHYNIRRECPHMHSLQWRLSPSSWDISFWVQVHSLSKLIDGTYTNNL